MINVLTSDRIYGQQYRHDNEFFDAANLRLNVSANETENQQQRMKCVKKEGKTEGGKNCMSEKKTPSFLPTLNHLLTF